MACRLAGTAVQPGALPSSCDVVPRNAAWQNRGAAVDNLGVSYDVPAIVWTVERPAIDRNLLNGKLRPSLGQPGVYDDPRVLLPQGLKGVLDTYRVHWKDGSLNRQAAYLIRKTEEGDLAGIVGETAEWLEPGHEDVHRGEHAATEKRCHV